jgi:hypothetical protein
LLGVERLSENFDEATRAGAEYAKGQGGDKDWRGIGGASVVFDASLIGSDSENGCK